MTNCIINTINDMTTEDKVKLKYLLDYETYSLAETLQRYKDVRLRKVNRMDALSAQAGVRRNRNIQTISRGDVGWLVLNARDF